MLTFEEKSKFLKSLLVQQKHRAEIGYDLLIDRSASMDNDQPMDDPIENLTKAHLALSVLEGQIAAARREFLRLYCACQASRLAYMQALLSDESARRAVLRSLPEADFNSAESSYKNAQLELERLEKELETADESFLSGEKELREKLQELPDALADFTFAALALETANQIRSLHKDKKALSTEEISKNLDEKPRSS